MNVEVADREPYPADRIAIPDLPIGERWDELLTAIRAHRVLVVAGETGSGKSTQLPQLCLAAGRGTRGLIGHTQPRRVAARTIAERIADELGTDLGDVVGYTVRFTDRVRPTTRIKVMTDGILLAEIQRDRDLHRYDTIIVDEAHERSLNVDFLLGYLTVLLRRRDDLHVIVTSATIDTARFAAHFAEHLGIEVPVIEVSGRTHPVEIRYRPLATEPDDDRDQVQAVIDAAAELAGEGPGDVLVFLSGEREIHDTADALRVSDQLPRVLRGVEVLPLYARLSAAEQHRIFEPHVGRRVVLSTNVAETSLTVPGVRYVVDAGAARVSRYSTRLKVQRLPIEPVSQASANQRAGRCGRVAPGICVRLYEEADFAARPEFTEPEILRTNLASVILQMAALELGDLDEFPFLDPPDRRAVRDGYALLAELGALSDVGRLTTLGRRLARLPIDPRLGRMVLEADRLGCVREVMVIAAALSIQDPRERPAEHRQRADELHRRFLTEGSDLIGWVRLWDHLRERQRELSSNQFRKLCRAEFLNYLRVREWQDLYSQLKQVANQVGIHLGTEAGHPDRVHQAVLSGLLSRIGMRVEPTAPRPRGGGGSPAGRPAGRPGPSEYRGAHGATFALAGGGATTKAAPRWVMAAELVETNRLWARGVAPIRPEWAERTAGSLAKRTHDDPRWDATRGSASVIERVTLYGLPIVAGRNVPLERIDPAAARALFVRHAMVWREWEPHPSTAALLERNRALLDELRELGARARSGSLVDDHALDELLCDFYDARLPADVASTRSFERWWREARRRTPDLLTLTRDEVIATGVLGTESLDANAYPATWEHAGVDLDVDYRFDPGADDDGVTVSVPLAVLNQVDESAFDAQVPGLRAELVAALTWALPKAYRKELSPVADTAAAAAAVVERAPRSTPFLDALAAALTEVSGVIVPRELLDMTKVPAHLRVGFAIVDDDGRRLGSGDDLAELRRRFAPTLRALLRASAPIEERTGITTWDVGALPEVLRWEHGVHVLEAFPGLVDDGDTVSLRLFTRDDLPRRTHHGAVRRLVQLAVPISRRVLEQHVGRREQLVIAGADVGGLERIGADAARAATDHVVTAFTSEQGPVRDGTAFDALVGRARDDLPAIAADTVHRAVAVLAAANDTTALLDRLVAPSLVDAVDDARTHLARLVRPGFVVTAGVARIGDVERYVRGIERRMTRIGDDLARDAVRTAECRALEQRYRRLLDRIGDAGAPADVVELGWTLEELRVQQFAQTLGTKRSVSVAKVAAELSRRGA